MGVINDPDLEELLAKLHHRSVAQQAEVKRYYDERAKRAGYDEKVAAAGDKAFLSDKMVALDRDKAEFCYQLCRAGNARRVVEIGTSFGVSTLYLAAAVRDNIRAGGGSGLVIGTEYEHRKAVEALKNLKDARLDGFVDLREGDLRESLQQVEGPVDFVLIDIWIAMARPALERVHPHLRIGAQVVCDNTERYRETYAEYFSFLADPANGFSTMTLPFDGGLELSVMARRSTKTN